MALHWSSTQCVPSSHEGDQQNGDPVLQHCMASLRNKIQVPGAVCLCYLGKSIGADGPPMNTREVRYKVARIMGYFSKCRWA